MSQVPAGWIVESLGSLVDVLDARRIPVSANERAELGGQVPYYGATGQVGWIDRPLFNESLLLLGEDGVQFFDPMKPKAYRIDGPSWVNNHAHVLRAGPSVDQRFLEHYLNVFDYRGYANGTTRLKLTQGAMRRIPVCMPGLDEQRRISDIIEDHLSRLDFASGVLRAGRRTERLVEASARAALVSSDVLHTTIGEISRSVKNGIFVSRASRVATGVPILRIGSVRPMRLDHTETGRSGLSESQLAATDSLLAPGDVLFTRYNGNPRYVASAAIVPPDAPPLTYPDKLIRVRTDSAKVIPEYLEIAASFGQTRDALQARVKTTSGQAGISGRDLRSTPIAVPDIATQHGAVTAVRNTVAATDSLRRTVQDSVRRADRLRTAILTAAFSGRLTGRSCDLNLAEDMALA